MAISSLRYQFRQPFRVAARSAYAWCTDFESDDGKFFAERWERSVRRLAGDALVLTDTTYPGGRARRIHRLVRLDPSELAWTNTHLDGPFQHSQYWYRIVPDGPRTSHLEFRGLRLVRSSRALSPSEVDRRAEQERRSDSGLWRLRLAPALERELAPPPRATRGRGPRPR
ncbi:MAG: hypothetical protein ACLQD8_00850 [Thermoplasmata archaeon]